MLEVFHFLNTFSLIVAIFNYLTDTCLKTVETVSNQN